jgi:predicted metal-dependent HD superfamily phosphohydrolase
MNLVSRWTKLFGSNTLSKFDNLLNCYSKNFYHNLTFHIAKCLTEFDKAKDLVISKKEVEIALWFHDVKFTEISSFDYFLKLMNPKYTWKNEHIDIPNFDISHIKQLILATNHNNEAPDVVDATIIRDIDLSIFGQNRSIFNLYEKLIRLEYRHVPDKFFIPGRIKVLVNFLSRKHIYCTSYFQHKYEKKARMNLEFSIKQLKK